MPNRRSLLALAALPFLSPLAAGAENTAGPGVVAYAVGGTGGIGGGLGYRFNDVLTLRGEIASFTHGDSIDRDGISFTGDLKLATKALLLDVHPFSGSFRLTLGLDSGRSRIGGTAVGNGGSVTVNGVPYTYGPSDWISAEVRYPGTVPYVGIGWGLNGPGLNVGFDLGVNIGRADLTLANSPSLSLLPGFDGNLAAQRARYEADVADLRVFPVVKLSVGYSF